MLREIEFRGKIANGEWVYGSLIYSDNIEPAIYFEFGKGTVKTFDFVYVKPETVGQFTGLKDKNGKKIFEGDIVNATYDCGPAGEKERIVEVVFGSFGTNLQDWIFKEDGYLPEIIGNVHDNPESLGGK